MARKTSIATLLAVSVTTLWLIWRLTHTSYNYYGFPQYPLSTNREPVHLSSHVEPISSSSRVSNLSVTGTCPKDHFAHQPCKESEALPDLERMQSSPYQIPICVEEEQFTVVMLSHIQRVKLMLQCLINYSNMQKINKVLLVWSTPDVEPPMSEINKISFKMPLEVVRVPHSLQARFQPFKEIKTQGKLELLMVSLR